MILHEVTLVIVSFKYILFDAHLHQLALCLHLICLTQALSCVLEQGCSANVDKNVDS